MQNKKGGLVFVRIVLLLHGSLLGINQPESERIAYTMLFRYNMSMEALAGEVYLN